MLFFCSSINERTSSDKELEELEKVQNRATPFIIWSYNYGTRSMTGPEVIELFSVLKHEIFFAYKYENAFSYS